MLEALRNEESGRNSGLEALSDEEIVAICKKQLPGDITGYRELLRRYEGLVVNTCNKMIGSMQDAEEVAQDAFLQLFHKIHQFEGRSTFRTWFYKIVHNYCRNRIAKISRKRKGAAAYEEYAANNEPDIEDASDEPAIKDVVEDAMSKLPEKDREILVMKFTTGLTIQEISDVMEIGLSAAKMRLYRALDAFKEHFERTKRQTS